MQIILSPFFFSFFASFHKTRSDTSQIHHRYVSVHVWGHGSEKYLKEFGCILISQI